ncbi:hypothetical protein [Clostridium estertheticum]|uniref:Uncharacterized protein n=1 Tax=Clostridium estertheticum TaxID=238834 RepID=A0A7Y3T3T0_9CLOT|nr:hypothetical protein [Clostridium estertheticum]NNU78754.1 hypothetical protein [Clostridium estertheticum]WBL49696.1 hypothetical protein LOR37_23530 [Clostridium estertheticum]
MPVSNTILEKKVYDALKSMSNKSEKSISGMINQLVGTSLGVQTNEDILDEVQRRFEMFIKQNNKPDLKIEKYTLSDGSNAELLSQYITFGKCQKQGHIRLYLTDHIASICFRFDSRDTKLRTELNDLFNLNKNKWIKLHLGSKHSSIGLLTRNYDDIGQMDAILMYNILIDLYNLI